MKLPHIHIHKQIDVYDQYPFMVIVKQCRCGHKTLTPFQRWETE